MNEIKVSINRNGLFSKKITFIFINDKWRKYAGGDIGRLFKRSQPSYDKATSLPESPSNVSPASYLCFNKIGNCTEYLRQTSQQFVRFTKEICRHQQNNNNWNLEHEIINFRMLQGIKYKCTL